MKQSMKESMMSGFWGKALIAGITLVVAFMGIKFVQPKISAESAGIVEKIIDKFSLVIYVLLPVIVMRGPSLLSEKIQAGITKQKNKDEAEIKKVELENEKIRLQNEQLELQNRQLELQRENQQTNAKE